MTYILFKCHRSTDNPITFIFLSCREKAHDNNKSSRENSKPCLKSRISRDLSVVLKFIIISPWENTAISNICMLGKTPIY